MTLTAVFALLAVLVLAVAALTVGVWRVAARARPDEASRAVQLLQADLAARVDGLARTQAELQRLLNEQLSRSQGLLQQQLQGLSTALRDQLGQQTSSLQGQNALLQRHMEGGQQPLSALAEKMGAVQQASARMAELGREMEELQALLKSPKARGTLGEVGLEALLCDLLPRDRVLPQYAFSDGRKVDYAVRLERGLLPIDAKFPVEDFERYLGADEEERPKMRRALQANLKKKVDEIARLYVRPGEGTLPLALLYLPAESLYYEAFVARERDEEDLWQYAFSKSVLPLSPATLSAYLKTVALGLRAVAVEQNARLVLDLLHTLERDLAAFRESYETLGRHLNNAHQTYDRNARSLEAFENHLARAKDLGGEEPPAGGGS